MSRLFLAGLAGFILAGPALADRTAAEATIQYLRKLQASDGGFLTDAGKAKSSLRATTSALRALKYFGGEASDCAASADFVKKCFVESSGGFADSPGGKPDAVTSAVGVMALVELKISTARYEAAMLQYLADHAKSFDEVRLAAAAVEALGKRPRKADEWLAWVDKYRNPDGTYGSGKDAPRATGGAVAAVLRLGGSQDREPRGSPETARLRST